MFKTIISLFLTGWVLLFFSCAKEKAAPCTGLTLQEDRRVIDSFINANKITYYNWGDQAGYYEGMPVTGTGSTPTKDSLVGFTETISLLNNTKVNERPVSATQPLSYYTSPLLVSALSKLKKGGVYNMILPSSSAYALGCKESEINGFMIPANSQLIYSVQLTEVKQPQTTP